GNYRLAPPALRARAYEDRAAPLEREGERLAQPEERAPHVCLPEDRERLPALEARRPVRSGGAGVEHEDARPLAVDDARRGDRVGRVRRDRLDPTLHLAREGRERARVARHGDDAHAGPGERLDDAPPEAAA